MNVWHNDIVAEFTACRNVWQVRVTLRAEVADGANATPFEANKFRERKRSYVDVLAD